MLIYKLNIAIEFYWLKHSMKYIAFYSLLIFIYYYFNLKSYLEFSGIQQRGHIFLQCNYILPGIDHQSQDTHTVLCNVNQNTLLDILQLIINNLKVRTFIRKPSFEIPISRFLFLIFERSFITKVGLVRRRSWPF